MTDHFVRSVYMCFLTDIFRRLIWHHVVFIRSDITTIIPQQLIRKLDRLTLNASSCSWVIERSESVRIRNNTKETQEIVWDWKPLLTISRWATTTFWVCTSSRTFPGLIRLYEGPRKPAASLLTVSPTDTDSDWFHLPNCTSSYRQHFPLRSW